MDARLWQREADGGLDRSETDWHRGRRFCRAPFGVTRLFELVLARCKLLNFIVRSTHVKRNDTICKIDCVDRALLAYSLRRHIRLARKLWGGNLADTRSR